MNCAIEFGESGITVSLTEEDWAVVIASLKFVDQEFCPLGERRPRAVLEKLTAALLPTEGSLARTQ